MRKRILVWILLVCMLVTTYIPELGLDYDVEAASEDISDFYAPSKVYLTSAKKYDYSKMGGSSGGLNFKGTVGENGSISDTNCSISNEDKVEKGISGTGGLCRIGISAISDYRVKIPTYDEITENNVKLGSASAMSSVKNCYNVVDDTQYVYYVTNSRKSRYYKTIDDRGYILFTNNKADDYRYLWATDGTVKVNESGLIKDGETKGDTYRYGVPYMDFSYRKDKSYVKDCYKERKKMQQAWVRAFGTSMTIDDTMSDIEVFKSIQNKLKKTGKFKNSNGSKTVPDYKKIMDSVTMSDNDNVTKIDENVNSQLTSTRVEGDIGWIAANLQYFSNGGLWLGDSDIKNTKKQPERTLINNLILYFCFAARDYKQHDKLNEDMNNWNSPYINLMREMLSPDRKLTHMLTVEGCHISFRDRDSNGLNVWSSNNMELLDSSLEDKSTASVTVEIGQEEFDLPFPSGDWYDNVLGSGDTRIPEYGGLGIAFIPDAYKKGVNNNPLVQKDSNTWRELRKRSEPISVITTYMQAYQIVTGVNIMKQLKNGHDGTDENIKNSKGTWDMLFQIMNSKDVRKEIADSINNTNDENFKLKFKNASLLYHMMSANTVQYFNRFATLEADKANGYNYPNLGGGSVKFAFNICNSKAGNGPSCNEELGKVNNHMIHRETSKLKQGKGTYAGKTGVQFLIADVWDSNEHRYNYPTDGEVHEYSVNCTEVPHTVNDNSNATVMTNMCWANSVYMFMWNGAGLQPRWTTSKNIEDKNTRKNITYKDFLFRWEYTESTGGLLVSRESQITTSNTYDYTLMQKPYDSNVDTTWNDKVLGNITTKAFGNTAYSGNFTQQLNMDSSNRPNKGYCQWGFTVIVPDIFPELYLPTPYYGFDVYSTTTPNDVNSGFTNYTKNLDSDPKEVNYHYNTDKKHNYTNTGYLDNDTFTYYNRIDIRCDDRNMGQTAYQCLAALKAQFGEETPTVRFDIKVSNRSNSSFSENDFVSQDSWKMTTTSFNKKVPWGTIPSSGDKYTNVKNDDGSIRKNDIKDLGTWVRDSGGYSQKTDFMLGVKSFESNVAQSPKGVSITYDDKSGWFTCLVPQNYVKKFYDGEWGWYVFDTVSGSVYPQEVVSTEYTVQMRVHYGPGLKKEFQKRVNYNSNAEQADLLMWWVNGKPNYDGDEDAVIHPKEIKYNYCAIDEDQPNSLCARYTRESQYLGLDTTNQPVDRYVELKDGKDAASEQYEAMSSQVTLDTLGNSDLATTARTMHINIGGQAYILKMVYTSKYNRSINGTKHANFAHILAYSVYTVSGVEIASSNSDDKSDLFGNNNAGESNLHNKLTTETERAHLEDTGKGTTRIVGDRLILRAPAVDGTAELRIPTTSYEVTNDMLNTTFDKMSRNKYANEHSLADINTGENHIILGIVTGIPDGHISTLLKLIERSYAALTDDIQMGYNGKADTIDKPSDYPNKLYHKVDCSSPIDVNKTASNRAYTDWVITPTYSINTGNNNHYVEFGLTIPYIDDTNPITLNTYEQRAKNKYLVTPNRNDGRQCNEVVVLDPITVQPNFIHDTNYKGTIFKDFVWSVNEATNNVEPTDQRWNGHEYYTTQDNVFLTHDMQMSITFLGDFQEEGVDKFGIAYGSDAIGNVINATAYNTTPFVNNIDITFPVDCELRNSMHGDVVHKFLAGEDIKLNKTGTTIYYNGVAVSTIKDGCAILNFAIPLSASEVNQANVRLRAYATNLPHSPNIKNVVVSRETVNSGDDYKNVLAPNGTASNNYNTVARANKDKTKTGDGSVNALDSKHLNTQLINASRQALNLFRSDIGTPTTTKSASGAIKSNHETEYVQPIDVVGYIGNLTVLDTGDFRYSNLFKTDKQVNNVNDLWLIPHQIAVVDIGKQNNIVADLVRMDSKGKVTKPTGMVPNTPLGSANSSDKLNIFNNLQPFKNSNIAGYELPLNWETLYRYSVNNNKRADAYKYENPKIGYSIYASLETVGNYYGSKRVQYNASNDPVSNGNSQCGPTYDIEQSGVEIRPKYKNKNTGEYLDVYVEVDNKYEKINDSNDGHVNSDTVYKWPYTLTWKDEYIRREVLKDNAEYSNTKENKNLLGTINTLFNGNEVMEETINLGNVNKLMLYQEARTFIGDSTNEYISDKARTQAQRWHFTLGLPSASKFTEPGAKPKPDNFLDISNLEITNTISVVAKGEIWTIAYDNRINGDIPTTAVPDFPSTNPDEPRNPPEIPVVEYGFPNKDPNGDDPGKPKTAQDDLTIRGTH